MSRVHTYDPRFSAIKKMQKNGKNASTMLQDNRNLILQLIREHGEISRKQLAEESGLQQATVTIIMKELLEQGLVRENGMIDGGNGRRVKSFTMMQQFYTIVVRLTGVYIKIALFDLHIQPLYVQKIFFETEDYIEEVLGLIEKHIREIEKIVDKEKILSIIIGVEHLYRLMNNDYAIWDEQRQQYCPIGKLVYQRIGYKTFVNRAINFSSYEAWDRYKEYKHMDDDYAMMVNVQLSYDLEGAIIVNNELLYGMEGLCGQLRDLPIDRNSGKTYKDVVTVPALLQRAKELLYEYPDSCIAEKEELNVRDIIAGYGSGDALCKKVYEEVVYYLGYLFAQILNLLDPDVILIGDEIPALMEFVEELQKEASKYTSEDKAKRIGTFLAERQTKNDPALVGGAKYVFDLLFSDIGIF